MNQCRVQRVNKYVQSCGASDLPSLLPRLHNGNLQLLTEVLLLLNLLPRRLNDSLQLLNKVLLHNLQLLAEILLGADILPTGTCSHRTL